MAWTSGRYPVKGNELMAVSYGFSTFDRSIESCINQTAALGLTHLEVDLMQPLNTLESLTASRVDGIRAIASDRGIGLSFHASYRVDPAGTRGRVRRSAVAYLKRCVEMAACLDAHYVTMHCGYFPRSEHWPWRRREGLKRLSGSLGELLGACERLGVRLAVENVIPRPAMAANGCLGDRVADFEFLFTEHAEATLGLCLDVGHAHVGGHVQAFLSTLGERIICVHCHDNHGWRDEHLGIGEGTVPWSEVAGTLKAMGYDGPMVSECFAMAPETVAQSLKTLLDDAGR